MKKEGVENLTYTGSTEDKRIKRETARNLFEGFDKTDTPQKNIS